MTVISELSLDEIANIYNTDKGTKSNARSRHGYAPIYEQYFQKWRHEPIRMLEIGICMEGTTGGHSVLMWRDYFTKACIHTFDIVDMSAHEVMKSSDRIKFFKGDQGNRDDFARMYNVFGDEPFDFILEDGSHETVHQAISFATLFQYVRSGGYYILEDMSVPGRPVCCIRNDRTYEMIMNFKTTGKLVSEHMTDDEIHYLETTVDEIHIHDDIQDAYVTAIIKKK